MRTLVAQSTLAQCRGVSVTFGRGASSVAALSDVDMAISFSERISLCGRSGSGKTTLLHVLGGLVTPTSGEVSLCGQPLASLDAAARGRVRAGSVAYVFQGANLLPTFTAFENVAFAAFVRGQVTPDEVPDPERLLQLVGLGGKPDALPAELSGGEAQRVAIARALAQQPALMLCDEPTGQLDSDTGARVLELIDALQRELRFALVIATHDPEVAARAERVVTLEDGRVAADQELEAA